MNRMYYINTTTPRREVYFGESEADLALMPTTTKIGEGEYSHALASEGSYALILEVNGVRTFRLRSTGWVETTSSNNGGSSSNIIEHIVLNGVEQSIVDKTVTLTVIDNTVNNLVNYYKKTETYTQTEINNLIEAAAFGSFEIVASLPTQNISTKTIYLVAKTITETGNIYDEFIYVNNQWEKIGDTKIDLSGYVTTQALNTALADYITTTVLTDLLAEKSDRVSNAVTGNFASLDANGNPADSGKKASDFVEAVQGKGLSTNDYTDAEKTKLAELSNYDDTALSGRVTAIETVVPSAATEQNKLSTATDVAGENISGSATGTAITLTDSADARVQGLTIKGQSEVVDGEIKSVGNDGLTVQMTGNNLLDETKLRQGDYNDSTTNNRVSISLANRPFLKGEVDYTFNATGNSSNFVASLVLTNSENTITERYKSLANADPLISKTIITPSTSGYFTIIIGKTDNSAFTPSDLSGINLQLELGSTATAYEPYRSTSADYTTGLPLCSIPDTTIHDEMNAGKEVVKQCGVVELDDLTFTYANNLFSATVTGAAAGAALCEKYTYKAITSALSELANGEFTMYSDSGTVKVYINDTNYSDAATFTTAVAGVKLIYPLETPITIPLTTAEISAFRQLRTFDSTTNINITDEPEYSIDYLKNTENGHAVADIQTDLQGQINDKIVVSGTLTLTAAGWSNGAQTVSFAHDTSKRNVIDITPSEIPKWAQYGVYAVSETSAGITFNCASTPNEALTFKVTSMEVTA